MYTYMQNAKKEPNLCILYVQIVRHEFCNVHFFRPSILFWGGKMKEIRSIIDLLLQACS